MTLHVETRGRGRDLVLLHGWGLHSGVWEELAPLLETRFRVHAVDLPGHGRSGDAAARSFDETADDIAQALPRDAVLCGWSLGGLLAQRIARRFPARLGALVLVGSTPCFLRRGDWAHGMERQTLQDFGRGLAQDRRATLTRFVNLNAMNGARGRAAARAFAGRLYDRGAPSPAALERTLGWLRDTDLRDDAAAIAVPTLVIHGARDVLAPVEAGRWLGRTVAGARTLEIEDAAHLPFFTHREQFARALEPFVA
jgi:pimeloyl-[acyl-carrier protein] methyl ester esterase